MQKTFPDYTRKDIENKLYFWKYKTITYYEVAYKVFNRI